MRRSTRKKSFTSNANSTLHDQNCNLKICVPENSRSENVASEKLHHKKCVVSNPKVNSVLDTKKVDSVINMDENVEDPVFEKRHRPLELLEKRSKKRELELIQYAAHLERLKQEAPQLWV